MSCLVKPLEVLFLNIDLRLIARILDLQVMTWVVDWQLFATVVLMNHGIVVWSLDMKLDLVTVPTWICALMMLWAETCVRPFLAKLFWCVPMTGLTATVKFRLSNRLNLTSSFCDLCFHRSLTTLMLLGGSLILVRLQVFWLSHTC